MGLESVMSGKNGGKYDVCHHAQTINVGQEFSDFVCLHPGVFPQKKQIKSTCMLSKILFIG